MQEKPRNVSKLASYVAFMTHFALEMSFSLFEISFLYRIMEILVI